MDLKDKIIELDDKNKYIVTDEFSYSNKSFLLLGKLNKSDDVEDLLFAELVNNKVIKIEDQNMIDQLNEICKMNLD